MTIPKDNSPIWIAVFVIVMTIIVGLYVAVAINFGG